MARLPSHRYELCPAWFEERGPLGVNCPALLVPDDKGLDPLAGDGPDIGKGVFVKERNQPVKGFGLALVRRCRKQQQVWRRPGETFAQLVPGDLIRTAAEAVRLIHDHQVPAGGDQVLEPVPIVFVQPLPGQPRRPSKGFTESRGVTT